MSAAAGTADLWDDAGAFWYRCLPPDTVASLFSGQSDMVTITPESGAFWMSRARVMGSEPFPDLGHAKMAGDAAVTAAWAAMPAKITKDAGLSPDIWSFSGAADPSFVYADDTTLAIVANTCAGDRAKRWTAWSGGNEVGDYAEPRDAADALLQRPALGL